MKVKQCNKKNIGCYICGEKPESVEHVPAQIFFPKHTQNKISVCSCMKHNNLTSYYDEEVFNIITCVGSPASKEYENNLNKLIKSQIRNKYFLKKYMNVHEHVFKKENGVFIPTVL